MHACGHDVHMNEPRWSRPLRASPRDEWSGTICSSSNPPKKSAARADAMIQDGIFKRFRRPDYAVAFHDSADVPTGRNKLLPGFTPRQRR